jgi:Flp pilus assembly protein TadB
MEWLNDYRKAVGWSVILSGLIVVVIDFVQGDILTASIVLAVVVVAAVLLAWWTRPSGGGLHVSHAAAQAAAGDGDVIVYWRPG